MSNDQHDLRAYVAAAHNYKAGRQYYGNMQGGIPEDPTLTNDIPQFIYPPIVAALFVPATWMPFDVFRKAWTVLTIGLLAHIAYMLGTLIPGGWYGAPLVAIALIGGSPTRWHLRAGQIDALILWLTVVSLKLLPASPALAGCTMALACWIKVSPSLMALYLLKIGGLSYAMGLLCGGLGILAIQTALCGINPFWRWIRVVLPSIALWYAYPPSAQSVRALMPTHYPYGKAMILTIVACVFVAPASWAGVGAMACAAMLLPNLGWTMQFIGAILPLWIIAMQGNVWATIAIGGVYLLSARRGGPGVAVVMGLVYLAIQGMV